MPAACITSSSRIAHPNLVLFPEMLIAAKSWSFWRRTSDVTRTPSTIPFVKAWTRIICSSYKFYRKHMLADSMGIPNAAFVSFVSVHQADVTSRLFHPRNRLMLAPFPPIFGSTEAKNLGRATHSLIILTKSLPPWILWAQWSCLKYASKVSPRQVNKSWMGQVR